MILIHGLNMRLIIIYSVKPEFGTDCVKVGKRHNLEFINIFTDDGKVNAKGRYGLHVCHGLQHARQLLKLCRSRDVQRRDQQRKESWNFPKIQGCYGAMTKPQWFC